MTQDISVHESALSQQRATNFSRWLVGQQLPAATLADVGCRCGYALMAFGDELPDTQTYGVDILADAVERAKAFANEAFVANMCERLPFGDRSVDWVFCSHTLEHLHDIPRGVAELVRIARYGIHVVVPLESDAKFAYYKSKSSPDGDAGMHYFHTMDPLVWLEYFKSHDLVLRFLDMSVAHSDVAFTLMHADKLVYGGNVYS